MGIAAVVLALYYISRVKKKSGRIVTLIYFELIFNLIIKFLIGNMHLPSMLNYVTDLILVWILLEYFHQKRHRRIPKSLVWCFTCLWVISFISYVLNIYSPLLYVWGFRNNFRFILFAMMCAVYLRKRDIQTIMEILYGFFCLNIVVVTYQYFFVSYSAGAIGDFISGLFSNGAERGGNASLCWLMVIVCAHAIVNYLNKTGTLRHMIFVLGASIYMASLAEIKIFYLEVIIIGIVSILVCRKSLKVFALVIIGVIGLFAGIKMLYYFFPGFADFFTYEAMMEYVTREGGYSSRGYATGIDRMTAIPYVMKNFLTTSTSRLFGRGLGNADYSSFSFLTSQFYKQYSWSGYSFFYSAFITIEMGLVGLITYIINILNYMSFSITSRTSSMNEKSVNQTALVIGLICILSIFANPTMKLEASAYMVYLVLAMPFALKREDSYEVGESIIGRLPVTFGRKK